MMESKVVKIIKEEIEKVMYEKKFKKDFEYLSPFNFMGKSKNHIGTEWIFSLSFNKNKLGVKVREFKNGTWSFSVESDGRGSEHDAKVTWGPFSSYEELKKEIKNKINNNLQFSTGNLRNERKDAENDDLIIRIKELMKKGDVLMSLRDDSLKDLRDLYKLIYKNKNLDKKELIDKINDEYHSINGVINALNKVHQIDYYRKLEKFKGY